MGECQEVARPSKVLGESHCLQQREEQVKYSNTKHPKIEGANQIVFSIFFLLCLQN